MKVGEGEMLMILKIDCWVYYPYACWNNARLCSTWVSDIVPNYPKFYPVLSEEIIRTQNF